jgi:hypothetical protein
MSTNLDLDDLFREARSRTWESPDELNAWLAKKTQAYNTRPQRDLAGLSPEQAHRLFQGNWIDQGPLRLNTTLSTSDLRGARFLANARILLTTLEQDGPTKATAASKNFNRTFVRKMIDRLAWDERYLEFVLQYNKVIDEPDMYPLHVLRIVLKLGGLIKLRSGKFSITEKGRKLLPDDQIGALYVHLVTTLFRSFNLAYLDGYPDNPALQHTLPMTLYRLRREGSTWRRPEELADRVLMDAAFDQPEDYPREMPAYGQFETRVLGPLEGFGLVEKRELQSDDWFRTKSEYRKSRLFDRAIQFAF